MLKEIVNVAQSDTDPGKRRWFSDDELDLIVWYSSEGIITGFQLCYDRQTGEHALSWSPSGGFEHYLVDSGEESFGVNRSPILIKDRQVPIERIEERFAKNCQEIEKEITVFVLEKLHQYNRT